MKNDFPDIDRFERKVFKTRDAMALLLDFSMKVLSPRNAGLLYGTNRTKKSFLPPAKWDRAVIHKLYGKGVSGFFLKVFGPWAVRLKKGLSPVRLYKETPFGEKVETEGVTSYVLRNHQHFYDQGVSILIIDELEDTKDSYSGLYSTVTITSYNGQRFEKIRNLKMNNVIVRQFKAQNFLSAYVPDYGAILFNTIQKELFEKKDGNYVREKELKQRLDILTSAIEMASLAHLGHARGRQAVNLIWRKEKTLRNTANKLNQKAKALEAQRQYLKAVGAVNERQLNMEAVNIPDGVYAFMDMVGSATIRKHFIPRDYFFILNLCHQIAADNANTFACRVDNFIGDGVFLQNASPFDVRNKEHVQGQQERLMLMTFALASIIRDIHRVKTGIHELDSSGFVKEMISQAGTDISFRCGLEVGPAMIGPLGSQRRKIVTAIGKAVNTASRLESSGVKEYIHVSENVASILQDSYISEDEKLLWPVLSSALGLDGDSGVRGIHFLDAFQQYFEIEGPVVEKRNNVAYKEYSSSISFLIKCIPDPVE